jgi:hypothetical protein
MTLSKQITYQTYEDPLYVCFPSGNSDSQSSAQSSLFADRPMNKILSWTSSIIMSESLQKSCCDIIYEKNELSRKYENIIAWINNIDLHPSVAWSNKINLQPAYKLTENVISTIGEGVAQRFEDFQNEYSDGWNFGNGSSLSPYSTASLIYFVSNYKEFPTTPSLFLTTNGNLQLSWENQDGEEIEIEFFEDRFDFYIDSKNIEDSIPLKEIHTLISLISK